MIEGSGSETGSGAGSVPSTSGSGTRRPKKARIRHRIPNTVKNYIYFVLNILQELPSSGEASSPEESS
jgi:hypothetical protein